MLNSYVYRAKYNVSSASLSSFDGKNTTKMACDIAEKNSTSL
jgi:hypothetical protein